MKEIFIRWQKARNIKWLINYHELQYGSWVETSEYTKLGKGVEDACFKYAGGHEREIERLLQQLENI